jgi:2-amino-4-hydroxy-6-hydroxymethyldihydropteridine diphosphokinase
MSLIIATGSNLGDSVYLLSSAKFILEKKFGMIAESKIYTSKAIEYENQPDFFNQVLELPIPPLSPTELIHELLLIEKDFGRSRNVPKGPRPLDLDIIFWNLEVIHEANLVIPHPRWMERSFVVKPLTELPFFQTIEKCFTIPKTFEIDAYPII